MSLNVPEQNIEKVEEKIEEVRKKEQQKTVFLNDVLKQANTNPIFQGDLFLNVKLTHENNFGKISHEKTKIENMDGFNKEFSKEEIEKIKIKIDEKARDGKNNFSLNQIDDKSLFALMQDQGISLEKIKIFENRESIVHLLKTFTDIDNENRENSKEEKRLYPASPEEGNSLSLKEGGVMRYDVAGYVRGYEEFFKAPKEIFNKTQENNTKIDNIEDNYLGVMQKIKEEKNKEQNFDKNEEENNLSQILGKNIFVHM